MSHKDLLKFYRLFLKEAGLPPDTRLRDANKAVRRKIKRTRSEAALFGWRRRKRREAKKKRDHAAHLLFVKRRRAALRGWETRRRNARAKKTLAKKQKAQIKRDRAKRAKAKRREAGIISGEVKPRTWVEKITKLLDDARLSDDDRVIVLSNADGSVDGELTIGVTNETAYDAILMAEQNLPLIPDGVFTSIGSHFNVPLSSRAQYKIDDRKGRPEELTDKTLGHGGGTFFTRYFKNTKEGYGFLAARDIAREIIQDLHESSDIGAICFISVRMFWDKGRKPS